MIRAAALEPSHQPPGTLLHRPGHELFHALELRRGGGPRVIPHHDSADLPGRHVRDHVHRDPLALDEIEILGERRPLRTRQAVLWRNRASLAEHIDGDALAYLALCVSVLEQRQVGVGVKVDETGRHYKPGGIDHPRGLRIGQPADGDHASVPDPDVAGEPGIAGPVHDPAVMNQHVEGRHGRLLRVQRTPW